MMKNLLSSILRLLRPSAAPGASAGVDFRALTEHNNDVVMLIGLDMRLRYVSPSIQPVLGWTPEEVLEAQETLIHEPDLPLIQAATDRLASGETQHGHTVVRIKARDGRLVWMESTARRLPGDDPEAASNVVVSMRDITERKALEDQLSAMAMKDGLTGLANRRAFDDALQKEWERTRAQTSCMSLVLIDLDLFKALNDRYGHQVGDDCLRTVADAVQQRAPDGALAARYGGEEIAIILPGTDLDTATALGETVRAAIAALDIPNTDNSAGGGKVTASIGVAAALSHVGGTIKMPEGLLMAADHALYRAKGEGRNRVSATMVLVPRSGG